LPNGKIMLTGGELSGITQYVPESFDTDFRSWSSQGTASGRTNHTSLITRDNLLITMGGWSGGGYLATTELINFNFYPDMNGLEAETTRQAIISSSDRDLFNQSDNVTLLSNTSNFHGITEASGGGAGPANASFHNPRVYMQQIDNPSGFMIDLSTWIYSLYGGINTNWEKTLSSITIITPNLPGVMPHGWYHMRIAAAGVFSDGRTVQVTVPRPTGLIAFASPAGTVLGSTTIRWDWTQNTLSASDGYAIFSSSNNVFISTTAFMATASYTQSGLIPNTEISVKIGGYNLGGYSTPLQESGTYYTFAVAPVLTMEYASFETVRLSWSPMGNSPLTIYEVTMSKSSTFSAGEVLTPIGFNENYTSTSAVITSLLPNQSYSFRVRAKSGRLGSGTVTAGYSNVVTTITVSNVTNLSGTPQTMSAINWSWDPAVGDPPYE
ncbi:MAG: fibronectin type III domain-containing protein, partial [Actinomycetota bacterium]